MILFEKLKLPYGKKTKTGYSTSADILEKLAPEHPLVAKILEYRQLAKLKSTYADGLVSLYRRGRQDPRNLQPDDHGHRADQQHGAQSPEYTGSHGAGTGDPEGVVPREGYVFVDADYSQIELRILAHMSGDEKLIDAYRHAEDIHRMTASQVFHVPFDEVTPLQRSNAKAVNFGIVYGISGFASARD